MQTDPKTAHPDHIISSFIRQKKTPAEIVNAMMAKFDSPARKKFKELQLMTAYGGLGDMPLHRQWVCAIVEALIKREYCAATFKTWGTGEEIAANMFKAKVQPSKAILIEQTNSRA